MTRTKEEVLSFVKENDVRFIRLQFTDIFGKLKNVAITSNQLENAFNEGIMFDGSSIDGFSSIEESDMFLFPDPNTFDIIPWRPQQGKVARIICDVKKSDGAHFEGDPRYILKKVAQKALEKGLIFKASPECEFFLFHSDNDGNPTIKTQDSAGYFDMAPIDMGENTRRDICLVLEEMGFNIEASHHETAAGQHEIDFHYDDVLSTADNIMTFKMVVKIIAQKYGLHATFMPKPIPSVNGSGMHINMSIFREGKNILSLKDGALSNEAKAFTAGILSHIKGITAIANPIVNSYKRLVPGYEAPVHIAWSYINRSPLLRVSGYNDNSKKLELSSPDGACNPYLTLAVILAAGLDGLDKKLELAPPIEINTYNITPEEEKALGIEKLPSTLSLAIEEMKKDKLINEVLGEHILNKYISAKENEWNLYNNQVHQWEIDNYLTAF